LASASLLLSSPADEDIFAFLVFLLVFRFPRLFQFLYILKLKHISHFKKEEDDTKQDVREESEPATFFALRRVSMCLVLYTASFYLYGANALLCFTLSVHILPLCVAFCDYTHRSGKGKGRGRKTTERKTIDEAKEEGDAWCLQRIADLNKQLKEKQEEEDFTACGKLKQEREWVKQAIKEHADEAKAAAAEADDDDDDDEDDGDAGDSRGTKRLRVGEYMCYHEPQEQGPPKYWSEYVGAKVKKEEEDDDDDDKEEEDDE